MLLAPITYSFAPFAYNYSVKMLVDILARHGRNWGTEIMSPILLLLGSFIASQVLWRISEVAEWMSEPLVRRSILLYTYDRIQNHPLSFFQNTYSGIINSKAKSLLEGYDKFWGEMHSGVFQEVLQITVGLVALYITHARLGLYITMWITLYCGLIFTLSRKLYYLNISEALGKHAVMGEIADKVLNILSIYNFATKRHESRLLDNDIKDLLIPRQVKVYKYACFIQIVNGVAHLCMFAFILFYSLKLYHKELITLGDVALIFSTSGMLSLDIWHAMEAMQDLIKAMGEMKSAMDILQTPEKISNGCNVQQLDAKEKQIQFKNICFSYDNDVILSNINIVINPGEKLGIVGYSGTGKSTLIGLLLRNFTPTSGQIFVGDQNIQNITEESLKANIAVVPQDIMLFKRSVIDNIRYGNLSASDEEVIAVSKKAQLSDFIDHLPDKYNSPIGERGSKISTGQRQRISIARAMLKNAPILILDEATSALDGKTEKIVQENIDTMVSDSKKTVIIIAHRLSTLKNMDRILVLGNKGIQEEGTHEELMAQKDGMYKKLWEVHSQYNKTA
ncbi:ABC transporter ATP-binding protein [Candidatus Sneabacter namystus]|nr:ABC transporter ATP-binding protein [Candidatus Sneabacter namystus]